MNIYKLAQIVKNLAENGFEDEANNLVDAIEQTPEIQQNPEQQKEAPEENSSMTANEIFNDPEVVAELEKIVGGMLHELLEDPNSSEATLSKLPSVFTELVSD
jgi:hypothetical protein